MENSVQFYENDFIWNEYTVVKHIFQWNTLNPPPSTALKVKVKLKLKVKGFRSDFFVWLDLADKQFTKANAAHGITVIVL